MSKHSVRFPGENQSYRSARDELPGRLRFLYPRMRNEGWLLSYREARGIHVALTNLSYRLSRHPHLETATHDLTDSRTELERCFHQFFPDVVAFARK